MIKSLTDVMLDVETLGTDGMFTILNITFIPFNILNGECFGKYSINIDIRDSEKNGFKSDLDTLEWWSQQDPMVFNLLHENTVTLQTAANEIKKFIEDNNFDRFWASAPLDYQAVGNLFSTLNLKNPINYRKKFCTRTIRMLHELKHESVKINNNHDPIQDCKNQINALVQQVKDLNFFIN